MKKINLAILLFVAIVAGESFAQSVKSNIFLDRSFWKSNPDVATVKAKIEEGNDPIALNRYSFDAITYAILENAPIAAIEYLLTLEGNEVDKYTHDGRNYLMWAAYKGNIPLMKSLIEKESNTMLVDDHGYNLITFAAVAGQQNPEVYDLILANGGKFDDTTRDGANALLLLAPHVKDNEMLDYFMSKGLDLKAKDKEGNNMFNYAARSGNKYMMDKLIEKGIDYKAVNAEGGNAFMFAASGQRGKVNELSTFLYLDNLGIDADIVTAEGRSPLHNLSFRCEDKAIFDFFIDNCVNVNQISQEGNTALMNATRGDNMVAIKKLLPLTDNVSQKNKDGFSALTFAVRNSNKEAFDFLVEAGADIQCIDKENRNLLVHIFDVYQEGNKEDFEVFVEAVNRSKITSEINFNKGKNLVHLAVEKGSPFLFEKALAFNLDVNHKDEEGLTPLHLAAMKAKNNELLKLLIENGADISMLTEFGESAYDLATENELINQDLVNLQFLKVN